MYPRLLTTPFFTIYTFGALLAVSYIAAFWWLVREGRRQQLDVDALSSLAFWSIGGAIVGAKTLLVLRSLPDFSSMSGADFFSSVLARAGDFYGGFIGAVIASVWFLRRHRQLPFWQTADICGPAIALGQAIGRVGCLMAGDDYGRPTTMPWAVTFTDQSAATIAGVPLGVPLHPVQAYESVVCLLLFVFLVRLLRRKRFDGEVVLTYTLLYATARFVLEFFRGDADRGFVVGWLSTSQFIAAILAPTAAALFVVRHRQQPRSGV
jgi:phosphatidylglycerol:prolipoprotein diacylglycerol transferase